MDWTKTKFRASSWGNLLSEPREKAAKDRGELSLTCQKELIKIYNLIKYGRKKDIVTKQMTKGTLCEPASIELYSFVKNEVFCKNEEHLENEWATGMLDLFKGPHIRAAKNVVDIKSSWDLDSFMKNLIEPVDPGYVSQVNVYCELTGATEGSIAYCLVDAPEEMILDELKRLQFKMNIIWDGDPVYQAAAEEIVRSMKFGDIPQHERVIEHIVKRDDELIQRMKDKVPRLREWLASFEKLHLKGRVPPAPEIDLGSIQLTKIKK